MQYTPTEALPAAGEQVAVTEEATQADDKPLLPGLEEGELALGGRLASVR